MKRVFALVVLSWAAFMATACQTHPDMRHTPQQYARLRNVELLLAAPTRSYQEIATVEGSGGRFTAKETMINAMIDAAHKAGADALIPLEFAAKGGLEQFVHTEGNRRITKGRAIRWSTMDSAPR
jgi:hypothetical protein